MEKVVPVLLVILSYTYSLDECNFYESSCHECIQFPGCAWDFGERVSTKPRCFSFNEDVDQHNETSIYNPDNAVFIKKNRPLDNTILNSPQKAKMRLRTRQPLYLQIVYKGATAVQPPQTENVVINFIHTEPSTILAKIELINCPKDPTKHQQTIDLLSHQSNQSLTLELEFLCTCPCEKPDHYSYKTKADQCTGSGTYICGKCECLKGHYGPNCECDAPKNLQNCVRDNVVCSGVGVCRCGACQCPKRPNPNETIFGDYCECDNFSCKRDGGKICGGPDHGYCECGVCACLEEWTGWACEHSLKQF